MYSLITPINFAAKRSFLYFLERPAIRLDSQPTEEIVRSNRRLESISDWLAGFSLECKGKILNILI